jgi:CelD/BcsL family acetyltransferase involved in cellulose biosynthesis
MSTAPEQALVAARRALADAGAAPASPKASAAASATLSFAELHSDDALVRAWQSLDPPGAFPTQSYEFVSALANSMVSAADIRIVFSRDCAGLAALLALHADPKPFGRWTTAGAGELSEPGDLLCSGPESARPLADALVRSGRTLELSRIPVSSPLIPALEASSSGKGRILVRPAVGAPTIPLDQSWKDPLSRFNSGRRSDFRRAARKADALGAVSYEVLSPTPDELGPLFDEAIALEARSWKRESGTAIAVKPGLERFFRHFFRSACGRGTFRIAFMRIDGRSVATQMALECSGRYWLFKIGYDEDYQRCSPGTLLMLHTIGWAASRGLEAYELLGEAEPWIGQLWTQDQQDCVRLRYYPYNLGGAAAVLHDASYWLRKRLAR